VGVSAAAVADQSLARELAAVLAVPLLDVGVKASRLEPGAVLLTIDAGVPGIRLTGRGSPGAVSVDFVADKALAARRRAGHNELLGRAVGWKAARSPSVLDTTGGFGRDAFLLADLGCSVLLCERQPLMARLLEAALVRAASSGEPWLADVCARMQLHRGDARELPGQQIGSRDVIYLDPMFPLDRRAAPGKEMQVLHQLLAAQGGAGEDDGSGLFAWALEQPVARVVVKRPRRAATLPGPAPGHSLQGRSVRFDVYPRPEPGAAISGISDAHAQA
jgi:16S rRNA (guanine1516-N2)-methyltransferase